MVIASARRALKGCSFDVSGKDVVLIVSTTKANVSLLHSPATDDNRLYPGVAAKRIARQLGITTSPIVVDDACISGAAALITASRLLGNGDYRYAIVCGADHQNQFIVSGFQSFKALSQTPCRPFDMERLGLNLGEAAATMILSTAPCGQCPAWVIIQGAIRNDAYHISAPSRQGEGARRGVVDHTWRSHADKRRETCRRWHTRRHQRSWYRYPVQRPNGVEGRRATMLTGIPVNCYKGYYGHTMGAAGVLETILTMAALDSHVVLATRGYSERGVSGKIDITKTERSTDRQAFLKMLSGFGGCNAALLVNKQRTGDTSSVSSFLREYEVQPPSTLAPKGCPAAHTGRRKSLTELYKSISVTTRSFTRWIC